MTLGVAGIKTYWYPSIVSTDTLTEIPVDAGSRGRTLLFIASSNYSDGNSTTMQISALRLGHSGDNLNALKDIVKDAGGSIDYTFTVYKSNGYLGIRKNAATSGMKLLIITY